MVLTQLEVEYEDLATLLDKFPYHYGSYATPPGDSKINKSRHVSIPLWFSRNQKKVSIYIAGDCVFPYHYGSYATDTAHIAAPLDSSVVSIPLWFSRNARPPSPKAGGGRSRFHTTMVHTRAVLR